MSQITNFPITVYGNKEKFNDTITRGRCRVFHKGHNRNGTYITNEFAQKLIQSAPYTPVKGIYNIDDYTDHGKERSEGRIYGIIPADPNFAWEQHEDFDGIVRDYACFDVLYYTALYGEAKEIAGKGESMELYRGTLKGSWQFIEGKKAYVFSDGCFLGLQVLGDDTEPCFEGASFYTQEESIMALLEKYEKRKEFFSPQKQQGENIMNINFKLSDSRKHDLLFNLLNPNFNEEGGWSIDCSICEVFTDYAIIVNYAEGIYERVYYTKDDVEDKIEITNRERCYIVDVNAEERTVLETLKGAGTYAEVANKMQSQENTINEQIATINSLTERATNAESSAAQLIEENQNYSTKVGELEENISTLTTERDNVQGELNSIRETVTELNTIIETKSTEFSALTGRYEELTAAHELVVSEKDALATFKKETIDAQKKEIIAEYVGVLETDILNTYSNNLDNYSIEELDMHLTYAVKKSNPAIFSKNPAQQPLYVPKEEPAQRGINDILVGYERK